MGGLSKHRVGVDIGGTFTDVVLLGADGRIRTRKIASTPDDYGRAIVAGIVAVLDEAGIGPGALEDVVHATTVATNTVLEERGAVTGLVTTTGFRDVLEMRRLRIPTMYDLQYQLPAPLAPRRRRVEVDERLGPDGAVRRPLDTESVRAAARRLAAEGVEAVAVALLHSYANPAHEEAVATILAEVLGPQVYIARSADILPEIREYERTSTAVVSAYIGPVVKRYLSRLDAQLRDAGVAAPLRVMQSNGGAMTAAAAIRKPAAILESGPAAGVIACARVARRSGHANVISLDMGGTTAKAAMIENGEPARTTEYEVGAGISLSSRLVKGGGHAVKLPFIDVSEIGAGGGSIVSLGPEGTLRVGPRSAGAVPGPVCYGAGGSEPTFTDAVVTLGYLNPRHLVGGALPIDAAAARAALEVMIAEPLGRSVEEAAYGIYQLAAATMTRAVKAVTTYRGRDPRDFVLFAFGGNGPVAAAAIARDLGIARVMVPPAPGVFSALGLPFTAIEHEFRRTLPGRRGRSAGIDAETVERAFVALEAEALAEMAAEGFTSDRVETRRSADLRYAGQAYELTVPVAPGRPDPDALARLFGEEHRRTYGHGSDTDPVDLVNVTVTARGLGGGERAYRPETLAVTAAGGRRNAYFGTGPVETPVIGRGDLGTTPRAGPLIVEEYDSTCVVPPGARARLDDAGNIEILL